MPRAAPVMRATFSFLIAFMIRSFEGVEWVKRIMDEVQGEIIACKLR
jgi:hypothetical protein